ncbi:MAG: nitrilase-related carbon-nitrogen hydrolase, partial [bacterium]|nr:nitrilase-related carbon-nitrogen hydrolase [bacterium]
LPELFRTPYFPQKRKQNKFEFVEVVPSFNTRTMQKLAKTLGVVIIMPIYEMTLANKFFNTALVFNNKGKLMGKYRKIHIPQDPSFYEKDYFEAGQTGYKIFKTKFATFAVLICYDQWFPEAARMARMRGAEIIFYPTAIGNIIGSSPREGDWHDAWETVQRGHAIANSVYVAAINRVGREGKTNFWGQSFVADPFGNVVARASKIKDEILVASIDLSLNKFVSEGWGFLRNRRPDTYKL